MGECNGAETPTKIGKISKKSLEKLLNTPQIVLCFIDLFNSYNIGELVKFDGEREKYVIISSQKNIYSIVGYPKHKNL